MGSKFSGMCSGSIIRSSIFAILAIICAYAFYIPVNAQSDAALCINTWANECAPQMAAFGFRSFSKEEYPKCAVDGCDLIVMRSADIIVPHEHLTFRVDNIVALGAFVLSLMAAYFLTIKWKNSLRTILWRLAGFASGAIVFSLFYIARNVFFGYYVVNHSVETIHQFDNPIRLVLILFLIFSFLFPATNGDSQSVGNEESR